MASPKWTGAAADGNWNTGGNWDTGSAPAGGDTVTFDCSGTANVTTGPSSAINLAALNVRETYVGSWMVPIALGTITALSIAGSGGRYDLNATVTAGYAFLKKGVTLVASGGVWTILYASGDAGGTLEENGATITTKRCSGIKIMATSGGSANTTTELCSCSFRSAKNPGTLISDGPCSMVLTGTAALTAGTIGSGGTLNNQSSGTVSALTLKPGSNYPSRGAVSHTISQLNLWPGAKINRNPPGATLTISAETSFGYDAGDGVVGY